MSSSDQPNLLSGQLANRQREEPEGEPQAKRIPSVFPQSSPARPTNLYPSCEENDSNDVVDKFIMVFVGVHKQPYSVREDTICRRSGFFRAIVSSDSWKQDTSNSVNLPNIPPRAFWAYLQWLKTKEVDITLWFDDPDDDLQMDQITQEDEQYAFVDAYIFAERLDDLRLRRYVMKVLIMGFHSSRTRPDGKWCTRIWNLTSKDSHLRTFIVEWFFLRFAGSATSVEFVQKASKYPEEAREEFARLASVRGLPPNGTRPSPNGVAKRAFEDAMRARLLERKSK